MSFRRIFSSGMFVEHRLEYQCPAEVLINICAGKRDTGSEDLWKGRKTLAMFRSSSQGKEISV